MSNLSVTEYVTLGRTDRGAVAAGEEPASARSNITFTAAAGVMAQPLRATTRLIRVSADANCAISIAVGAVAVVTDTRLAAGAVDYFAIAENPAKLGTLTVSAIAA